MMDNLEKQLAVVSKRLDSEELWVLRDVVNKAIDELTTLRQYKAEAESQKYVAEVALSLKTADLCAHLNGNGYKHLKSGDKLYASPVPAGSCAVPDFTNELNYLYWSAYHSGHHDTVESCYIDVSPKDRFCNWFDRVSECSDSGDMPIIKAMLSAIPSNSEGEKS